MRTSSPARSPATPRLLVVLLLAAIVAPCRAQTPNSNVPPPSPQPPATATATPIQPSPKVTVPPDEQMDAKSVRQTCENYAKSEGLKDQALQTAVDQCAAKLHP